MFDLAGPFRISRPPSEDELKWMSKNSMWTDYEETSPSWLRLLKKDDLLIKHTAHLDDVQCFMAWLDYMIERGMSSFHMSTTRYLPPVDLARSMLEMMWGIEKGDIEVSPPDWYLEHPEGL